LANSGQRRTTEREEEPRRIHAQRQNESNAFGGRVSMRTRRCGEIGEGEIRNVFTRLVYALKHKSSRRVNVL